MNGSATMQHKQMFSTIKPGYLNRLHGFQNKRKQDTICSQTEGGPWFGDMRTADSTFNLAQASQILIPDMVS